jgi:RNA-directed DNA polymerase
MAHTYRELWPQLVAWGNLLEAYRRCRRRKRSKPEAAAFEFAWESELLHLQREMCDGSYQPGEYTNFYVFEPKKRKISAAPFRDRVLHHAVVRILEPLFERRFIFDSYACRRGKGTHRAVDRAQLFLRRYDYYLKTDIVRFFPNVDHDVLLGVIARHIRDDRLMELIRRIVASGDGVLSDEATSEFFPGDDLLSLLRPRGLPIGNLTSQFFANVLLDEIDHFVKEELRVPGYVRYADDLLLFGNSKDQLWEWRKNLSDHLGGLRLTLHRHKTHVGRSRDGVKFLGFVLHRDGRRLPQQAILRFSRRIRRLRWMRSTKRMSFRQVRESIRSWLVHAKQANTVGIRKGLWRRLKF